MPSAEPPNQGQWANWLQGEVGLYLPSDQALPQEVVAAYFEARIPSCSEAMTPADAAKQIQEAVVAGRNAIPDRASCAGVSSSRRGTAVTALARAFSSEVDTGSREENAPNKKMSSVPI